jgi:hypothetical protein
MNLKGFFKFTLKKLFLFLLIFFLIQLIPFRVFPCQIGNISVLEPVWVWKFGFCPGILYILFLAGPAFNLTYHLILGVIFSYLITNLILYFYNKRNK